MSGAYRVIFLFLLSWHLLFPFPSFPLAPFPCPGIPLPPSPSLLAPPCSFPRSWHPLPLLASPYSPPPSLLAPPLLLSPILASLTPPGIPLPLSPGLLAPPCSFPLSCHISHILTSPFRPHPTSSHQPIPPSRPQMFWICRCNNESEKYIAGDIDIVIEGKEGKWNKAPRT